MKTKVRIALAINSDGEWNCCGWSKADDSEKIDLAIEGIGPANGDQLYWLEAEIEIPQPETIQAEVTPA